MKFPLSKGQQNERCSVDQKWSNCISVDQQIAEKAVQIIEGLDKE